MKHTHINRSLFALAAIAIGLTACGEDEKNNSAAEKQHQAPVQVSISTASGAVGSGATISGKVAAVQSANISTRIMGTITAIKVKVGDVVSAGQVLATIQAGDLQAKAGQTEALIAEAAANVKQAQKDYDRFQQLYQQQSASAKELEQMSLQLSAAKARLSGAQQMRNEVTANQQYTVLTAPFKGVVTQQYMKAGDLASPGMPLLQVEGSGQLEVQALVPESLINNIKKGMLVTVSSTSINQTLKANITEISPSSTVTGGQYLIKIAIPAADQKNVLAGMYVQVALPNLVTANQSNTIAIPTSSLIQKDDLVGVYTLGADSTARLRWLRIGKRNASEVEVLSGLGANEPFIMAAEGKLFNGAKVVVR